MNISSIIIKKRKRDELNDDEIKHFVVKYTKGEITEAQAGALLSHICEDGMTEDEVLSFTQAMASTGEQIDLGKIGEDSVDQYSTGGVGDKVTLILIPVLAALGIPIAKISSRGVGISSGSIHKLETIPGYTTEISIDEFKKNLEKIGVGIFSQTETLNPAENKIYKLRNEIACTNSLPIIASSIMSLKLSIGVKNLAFEINYGKGTYIKSKVQAIKLANLLKRIGKKLNKKVICIITSMKEPLGYSIGHNLEMIEAIEFLKGTTSPDLEEVVVTNASNILKLIKKQYNMKANEEEVRKVIQDGTAYKKLLELIKKQHGDTSYLEDTKKFKKAEFIVPVIAKKSGWISKMDSDIIGSLARYLGAGRMNNVEEIDNTAGIILTEKIGDQVNERETLAYIHTNDESKIQGAVRNLQEAFEFSSKPVKVTKKASEII